MKTKMTVIKKCLLEILRQDLPNDMNAIKIFLDRQSGVSNSAEQIAMFIEELKHDGYIEEKDERFVTTPKGIEALKVEEPEEQPPIKLAVSDLSAVHIGKKVIVEGRVSGEVMQMSIAKIVMCPDGKELEVDPYVAIFRSYVEYELIRQNRLVTIRIPLIPENVVVNQDYSILFIQNLLEQITGFDKRFYKAINVYVVGQVPPSAKKVKIKGTVIVSPDKKIGILADSVEPLETEVSNFAITEKDKENWINYFKDNKLDLRLQIAPDMMGRPLVQESRLLVLHSPPIIPDINDKEIRGCLKEVLIGDTKTYKSESMKDTTYSHYHFGDMVVAESGTRAGITYAIDTDKKAIIWGALVLNDLGYVAIDGLQRLHSDEMGEFREALEQQKVTVRRSQSGEALARTRITTALNTNKSKPINQYIFRCMALLDTYIFIEPANLTRWDIFLVFGDRDVAEKLIAERKMAERPMTDDIFKRHVFWVWSRKPSDVNYNDEAKKLIIEKTKEIMKEYSIASLPIVHNGFRDVLTRLAVAYACLYHSTNETHEKVIVDADHVNYAVKFYFEMFKDLQLKDYKLAEEGKLEITDNEFTEICQNLSELDYKILESIKMQAKSSSILADELDVSQTWIKEHYSILNKYGLIKTTSGVGIQLTPRGINFLKGISGKGKQVNKDFTDSLQNEKGDISVQSKLVNKDFTNGNSDDAIVNKDFTDLLQSAKGGLNRLHEKDNPSLPQEAVCDSCNQTKMLVGHISGLGYVCEECEQKESSDIIQETSEEKNPKPLYDKNGIRIESEEEKRNWEQT